MFGGQLLGLVLSLPRIMTDDPGGQPVGDLSNCLPFTKPAYMVFQTCIVAGRIMKKFEIRL